MAVPGPAVTTRWRDKVVAILCAFLPGEQYGNAIADLILARANDNGDTNDEKLFMDFAEFMAAMEAGGMIGLSKFVEDATRFSLKRGYGESLKKAKSLATGKLFYSSLVVLAFLVLHLKTFRFGAVYYTTIAGEQVRDAELSRLGNDVKSDLGRSHDRDSRVRWCFQLPDARHCR